MDARSSKTFFPNFGQGALVKSYLLTLPCELHFDYLDLQLQSHDAYGDHVDGCREACEEEFGEYL